MLKGSVCLTCKMRSERKVLQHFDIEGVRSGERLILRFVEKPDLNKEARGVAEGA